MIGVEAGSSFQLLLFTRISKSWDSIPIKLHFSKKHIEGSGPEFRHFIVVESFVYNNILQTFAVFGDTDDSVFFAFIVLVHT